MLRTVQPSGEGYNHGKRHLVLYWHQQHGTAFSRWVGLLFYMPPAVASPSPSSAVIQDTT